MLKNTSRLTFSALLCGLSVTLLWISSFFPTLSLTIVAIAGILIISVLIECGYKFAIICFVSTSILTAIIIPDKVNAIFYIFILGSYPIIKSLMERIKNVLLEWIAKGVYCNLVLFVLYFAFTGVIMEFIPTENFILPILLVGGTLFFVIYDLALSKLIIFYLHKIHNKFKL